MDYIQAEVEYFAKGTQYRLIFGDGTRGSVIAFEKGDKLFYKKGAEEPSTPPEGLDLNIFEFDPSGYKKQEALKVKNMQRDSETGAFVGFDLGK